MDIALGSGILGFLALHPVQSGVTILEGVCTLIQPLRASPGRGRLSIAELRRGSPWVHFNPD
jgi:hypothetical protein